MRSSIYALLSVFVYAILYSFTAILIPFAFVLSWLNLKKPFYSLIRFWARAVFLLIGKRFRLEGKEFLDKDSKYIVVANHASFFDILAIVAIYPELSWFGHERLLKVPVFGKILKMTGYIPFREPTIKNTRVMLEQLVQRSLKQSVAIFPEGTRTLSGNINDFYKGFIYLLRSSGMDILPVTLNGFYSLKPKNRFSINFGSKLSVIIHRPIKHEDLTGKSDNEIIETVKKTIESVYKMH